MKLAIFAKTFSGAGINAAFLAAKRAGYSAVHYNMSCAGLASLPESVPADVISAVRLAGQNSGVEIVGLSATYNMIHPDMVQREKGRRSFAALANAAPDLGTNLLTVCSGSCDAVDQWRHHRDNQSPAAWRACVAEFEKLLRIAEQANIWIGVEPEQSNVINGAERAKLLMNELGSERIRIVLDPANLAEQVLPDQLKGVVEQAVDLLAERIVMAHAKDRKRDGTFATVGNGVIDFQHLISRLKRMNFAGPLVTHGLGEHEAADVARFLARIIAG